ncbi:MAG TPA: hypothetical protein PK987_06035, partial [Ferruginibacter sp.]|nr:hypothetical protein [Ferruginibacter sp.]
RLNNATSSAITQNQGETLLRNSFGKYNQILFFKFPDAIGTDFIGIKSSAFWRKTCASREKPGRDVAKK